MDEISTDTAHDFGPWGPVIFMEAREHTGTGQAFYLATSRRCRGLHDQFCAVPETVTYGPFLMEAGKRLFKCPTCYQKAPAPANFDPAAPALVCLHCSERKRIRRSTLCRRPVGDTRRLCTKRRGHLDGCAYIQSISDEEYGEVTIEEWQDGRAHPFE